MRFFSKLTVLCNCCFLIAVGLWYLEMHKKYTGAGDRVIQLPAIESTFVIIGYLAIVINLFFLLTWFIFTALKVKNRTPKWMILFNLFMFAGQIFFHFYYK